MSKCSLISQPLILLSASSVASKPLCPCMLGTLLAHTLIICKRLVSQTWNSSNNVHFTYCVLNQVVTMFTRDNSSALCKIGAFVFYTVVRWHKLGKMESECILHNPVVLVIFLPKIIKISRNLTNLWQKQFWLFPETRCTSTEGCWVLIGTG